MNNKTTLMRCVRMVPGNQQVVVREYVTGKFIYSDYAAALCDSLRLLENQELRNAEIYGIETEGDKALTFSVVYKQ